MAVAVSKYAKTKIYDEPLYPNPKSTQELWPVKTIDEFGIFELGNNMFSKTYKLTDINFEGVTDAEQKKLIVQFSQVLNSMSCRFSYTIANEYVDEEVFRQQIMYKLRDDHLDDLRSAYNEVIEKKITNARQGLYQTIYLTLTITSESIEEARAAFTSLEAPLHSNFIQLSISKTGGSEMIDLDINERMQIWYNFTHYGMHTRYKFDYIKERENHSSWKDIVSPASIVFRDDYFEMNGFFGRVLYVSGYPKTLESDILSRLSNINCTSYISINNEILDTSALKQEISRKFASVGLQIENEKQRNRNHNDFLSDASDKLLAERQALVDLMRAVDDGDDHYFNTSMFVMFFAKNKMELEKLTEKFKSEAAVRSVELKAPFGKQRSAMNSTFMFGVQEFKRVCNYSATCLGMFMPFKTQELNDENGTFYGINQISKNGIWGNKKLLSSYNGLILGMTGSGKSFFAKNEIISTASLFPEDQVIIIDPMDEYKPLASVVNGTIISFDSKKEVYVNPLDVDFYNVDYTELQEIIGYKVDFILNLLASCMRRNLDTEEQGILGAVIEKVYSENYSFRKRINKENESNQEFKVPEYMRSKQSTIPLLSQLSNEEQIREYSPTLQDIYQQLKDFDNPVAVKLAAHMDIFVNGALNLFNHRTNINLNNKFLVFDLTGIKKNLRVPAMLVMLDLVKDKARNNFYKDIWTHLYIDEFHELLEVESVANFILNFWKEIRKMHGVAIGITQNMRDLVNNSAQGKNLVNILNNSEFFALLKQSTDDRYLLEKFLPMISPDMFNYVESAASGTGLLKMGNTIIPFDNIISKESKIYKVVNTSGVNNTTSL